MSSHTGLKTFALFGLLILLVAGCSPGAAATTTAPTAAAASTASSPPATEAPRNIVITIPEDPPSFNAVVGDTGYDSLVSNLVMLGLTGVDPDGRVYPELAAELPAIDNGGVKVDEAAGTMDVTWKLRPDVTWADGVAVTADDVVFTWAAITDPDKGTFVRGSDSVDSLEKIDDHTVVFHYKSIYPGYLTQLGGEQLVVWPAHYCDKDQGYSAWDCGMKPLSDGPFVLQDWQTGDHMTFVRNPKYFEPGKPGIDKITVQIVPDDAVRKTMLEHGDSDLNMWVSETIAEQLKNDANVNVSLAPADRWVLRLFPNEAARGQTDPVAHPNPIFADVRVRQALRLAIDVDTVTKTAFRGYSHAVWSEFHRPPYNTCSIARPAYDPAQAAALLEQAGWKDTNGDGVRECHGCAHAKEGYVMQAELATYPDYGEPMILAQQLIAEQLKKIGLDLKLTTVEGNVMWADSQSGGTEQTGNYDLDLWDDGYAGVDPTDYISEVYATSSATPDNGWNFVRWISPEMDDLISQAYTLDESRRQQVFCQMADLLDKQVPVILLASIINADAYSSRLSGIQSNINDVVTWNAADWQMK